MKPKLSLVTLGVSDLDRSRRFYEALGWEPQDWTPESKVVFFELNGVMLSLFGRDDLAEDVGVEATRSTGFSSITLAHNEPSIDDVDRAFNEFISAGATAVKTPQATAWGGYSGYVADPDGHLWEVAFNPFSDWT
ncbi:MAG: VOC family protein [Ilumatobacteraceae bacterium]|jgi:catechol 2,3-dioxygenase-like lactoylglutathione lyase family enzyme|nr:VOC family protein [Ilumatobacteraceae bacterium]